MKFIPKATQTSYQIDIDIESFNIITTWEVGCTDGVSALSKVLEEKTNAVDVDYNGHFGIAIFLTLEIQDDTPAEWENIQYIITEWIENAEKLCKVYDLVLD